MVARKIIRLLEENGPLTTHEICMLVNWGRVDMRFCRRCYWIRQVGGKKVWKRKPKDGLRYPPCRVPYIELIQILKKLVRAGIIRREKKKLRDIKNIDGWEHNVYVYYLPHQDPAQKKAIDYGYAKLTDFFREEKS